jgi:DNA-binding NtrC family response regulator
MAARIIVVDDDPGIRSLLDRALTQAGYEVVSVDNGLVAFEKIMEDSFDLVVTNNRMPGMSGAELVAVLRERRPDLPILHVDDLSLGSFPRALVPADVPTISKPFSIEALEGAVAKLLKRGGTG